MISQKRIDYWDKGHLEVKQGDSIPIPFKRFEHLFANRDVLEIGPGEGRQFQYIHNITSSYSLLDISKKVFDHNVYKNKLHASYVLKTYKFELKKKFDVIHFWYVLHHIIDSELPDFIDFLYKHLNKNGMILFNTPCEDNGSKEFISNGMQTTPYTLDQIKESIIDKFKIKVEKYIGRDSSGYLIIMKKFSIKDKVKTMIQAKTQSVNQIDKLNTIMSCISPVFLNLGCGATEPDNVTFILR